VLDTLAKLIFDLTAVLEDALIAHGVQTNRMDEVVSIPRAGLIVSAGVVLLEEDPTAKVVQLDVLVRSHRLVNKMLIESFAGVGPEESTAKKQAFGKFLRSSIHVLPAVLVDVKYGVDHIEWES
jgi:hypothetical protein